MLMVSSDLASLRADLSHPTTKPGRSQPAMTEAETNALRMAYAHLRALRIVDEHGWCTYVAGELGDGQHVLQLPDGTHRTLVRGEPYWWALGLADGHGQGDAVEAVRAEPLPQLLTTAAAAGMIPATDRWGKTMGANGLAYNINSGRLYAIYGSRRQRYLLGAQVAAETASRKADMAARVADRSSAKGRKTAPVTSPAKLAQLRTQAVIAVQRWSEIRALFPPALRVAGLAGSVAPKPSPQPLPIGRGSGDRRLKALMYGDEHGWFRYVMPTGGQYLVDVDLTPRLLPPEGVLPWVLGVADQHGRGSAVAYRDLLG